MEADTCIRGDLPLPCHNTKENGDDNTLPQRTFRMNARQARDLKLLGDAARLFAKVSGACSLDQVDESLDLCNRSLPEQVVSLRDAYERYLDECSCTMRDLVAMACRGDMLLRFGAHVRLDNMLRSGRLDRIYRREKKRLEQ